MRFVLILSLLLSVGNRQPLIEQPERPYRVYLPLVTSGTCQVVFQTPQDDSFVEMGKIFIVHWLILNTSENTWRSSSITINFVSGGRYHSGNDIIDLPYNVAPGGMLDWSVSLTAPYTPGSYVSNWSIRDGMTNLCFFSIKFRL